MVILGAGLSLKDTGRLCGKEGSAMTLHGSVTQHPNPTAHRWGL